jgi:hypothetical protein
VRRQENWASGKTERGFPLKNALLRTTGYLIKNPAHRQHNQLQMQQASSVIAIVIEN